MRRTFEHALDLLFFGLEVMSRRDCGLILAGLRVAPSERRAHELLDRMHRQGLVRRVGTGRNAKFIITAEGRKRAGNRNPTTEWNRHWDGKWRVFNYDLPETRRKDRIVLWRALRAYRFGLLQRSMWVWPHDVAPILHRIVQAHGIPECFCGFESSRLFLCDDAQVVATAWDFQQIARHQQSYLKNASSNAAALRAARDLRALSVVLGAERNTYHRAFALDPLLPRALWPREYAGPSVEQRHQNFRSLFRRRLEELSA